MELNETQNHILAEEINANMRRAVMPVTVFVGVEVFLGFFGNLVVLYVFLFRYHSCNFRYFVLCLALTDLTSTLTTMPGEIVTQLNWYVYPVPMICKIKSFFNVFTVGAEALCLLTIAVDRYRKVCHPFGWQIKQEVAKWLCLAIFGIAFVIALPVAIYWGTHNENYKYKGANVTVTICEKDAKYVNTSNPLIYSVSIDVILSISMALMFFLYVLIARTLLVKQLRYTAENEVQVRNSDIGQEETSLENVKPDNTGTGETLRPSQPTKKRVRVRSDSSSGPRSTTLKPRTNSDPRSTSRRQITSTKVRRKTLIMFILTGTFIVTTSIYLALLSLIAHGILPGLSDKLRAVYFFFFRFYFINHVINPFVYGVLDPKFRTVMLTCKKIVTSSFTASSNT